MYFDANFIDAIKKETIEIQHFCWQLNKDAALIEKLNSTVQTQDTKLRRSEMFFISDLILIAEKFDAQVNEKARFTLAYYYDVLRNARFADQSEVAALNKLVSTEAFQKHWQKIKQENTISTASQAAKSGLHLLSATDSKSKSEIIRFYKSFAHLAFGKSFATDAEFLDFFNIDDAVKSDNANISSPPENDSLEKVLEELHALIGLTNIKKNVEELINLLHVQSKRSDEGLKNIEITLHSVFLGPPGTGKTTVARLLGRIYKHLGYLSKGQLYETDREGMVAGYVGQTAPKVDKVIKDSVGGVLFIDEAYSLTQNQMGSDYGSESISILLKRMEDYRDDFAVVVAGYDEPMKEFIESNPGLRSRFNRFFHFENFTPSELMLIFESIAKKSDFIISDDAKEKLSDTFTLLYDKRDEGFGNARTVRNLFERCVQLQANRIIKLKKLSPRVLKTLTEADIPEPTDTLKQVFFSAESEGK